ncbi:D-glycerate dehydrogenase [Paenibacillus pectinilyticus]|uniref:D-glycerate dehydrogenase n=1 Tax=Paenibacillus pectinilyticus TaxID=512399 RepID=A0A1C0ZVA7_9BACL|nr:D-glycerate dehydrogenase [Paenibacillus pectinilyticus]OCT12044.1 D-glycerate dehydrogenase [Paenibacillus pectinilyticus]
MKPIVLITRKVPEIARALLQEAFELIEWMEEEEPAPRSFLEKWIGEVDGLYCLLTDKIDESLIARSNRLKVISTMAVGFNHIDVAAASKRGILVTHTPEVLTETTADLAFALILATARRLVEASVFLREGQWKTWSPMLMTGQEVYGATLGIIGMGRIGEAVARRASGFDMKILYHNRNQKPEAEMRLGMAYAGLEELLQASDFVVVLAPYTQETADMIRKEQLQLMKPSAILINVARGGIVNETDLYDALQKGTIWAAGLDVFDTEPVPLDHPLLTLTNVVTLPHIGSASIQTRMQMALIAAQNLMKGLAGERPNFVVNPTAWSDVNTGQGKE